MRDGRETSVRPHLTDRKKARAHSPSSHAPNRLGTPGLAHLRNPLPTSDLGRGNRLMLSLNNNFGEMRFLIIILLPEKCKRSLRTSRPEAGDCYIVDTAFQGGASLSGVQGVSCEVRMTMPARRAA